MGAGGDEMCDKDRSMDADGWVETAVPLSLSIRVAAAQLNSRVLFLRLSLSV